MQAKAGRIPLAKRTDTNGQKIGGKVQIMSSLSGKSFGADSCQNHKHEDDDALGPMQLTLYP